MRSADRSHGRLPAVTAGAVVGVLLVVTGILLAVPAWLSVGSFCVEAAYLAWRGHPLGRPPV